ncbi:MAG: hypothetical protein B7Y25_04715 [Alphaproteobacteria bacterium 16-39-46]|nr:MAG: hypothetical protein B7Y25_04715 [Alphaproteobacteria bacterium 16-39-46]OZA42900.1 MAG: hypothetical protein B7X84_04540 [Alphaproteobacteria bacterium 17-39-52]HQS84236.1 hypothetical protein [Alphaproteobacteria bacterium]HQS94061.1 hypothetical protein [Alphaproteobacteria bacterium]
MKNLLLNKSTLTALAVLALLSPSFVGAMNDPDAEAADKKAHTASARKEQAEKDLKDAEKEKASAEQNADKDNFSAAAAEQKKANLDAGGEAELTREQQNKREAERIGRQAKDKVDKVTAAVKKIF